jgi:biopolymer transport protein ExbD
VAIGSATRSGFSEMNVTPMLDVLLVLIVVMFLLNLPLPHLRVQVPPPGQAVPGDPSQLVLELPDAGGYLLNRQPVPDAELDAVLSQAFERRPVKLLFVDAGGERRYEEVVRAVDRAKGAGVQVVAFLPQRDPRAGSSPRAQGS